MKGRKETFLKLLFLPTWALLLLSALSAAALTLVFLKGFEESAAGYAAYVFSFYTLSVVCIRLYTELPRRYGKIKESVLKSSFGFRYFSDAVFKMHVNLNFSFSLNLLYAAMNLFYGIYYKTAWFMLFAAYYFIVATMRFILLRYIKKKPSLKSRIKELLRTVACACILITVNFMLSGAVLMMYYFDRGFNYSGILIYVMATYTFYITTAAIINVFRYRKYESPVMSMAKTISLATALMSMLSLETAMLSQFGAETALMTKKILILATGGGISVIITGLSIYTIRKSLKEIKKLNGDENNG